MAGREDVLQAKHLPVFFLGLTKRPAKSESLILKNIKADSEKEAVLHAMRISNYNKNKASKLLGIHRTALYKKMKKFNISLAASEMYNNTYMYNINYTIGKPLACFVLGFLR
jgi:transcriptional regulator with PAS, ATPase and Fis domain